MGAKSWTVQDEYGEPVECTLIEEGQASLDAYENSVAPQEDAESMRAIVESPADVTIDAARCAIKLLVLLIQEVQEGKTPRVSLKEIGLATANCMHLLNIQPNWYEKVTNEKWQRKLLNNAARSIYCAMNTLDNDMYATRVKNCYAILEDAQDELKNEGYEFEGDGQ